MSTLPKIVQAGHPVLRAAAAPVPEEMFGSAELASLTRTMVDVMRDAPGVGLAAPQIGVGLRVLVMEDVSATMARLSDAERKERGRVELPLTILVNPEIRQGGGRQATFFEGCLSVGGYMALVERHLAVTLVGRDVDGKKVELALEGWPARIRPARDGSPRRDALRRPDDHPISLRKQGDGRAVRGQVDRGDPGGPQGLRRERTHIGAERVGAVDRFLLRQAEHPRRGAVFSNGTRRTGCKAPRR